MKTTFFVVWLICAAIWTMSFALWVIVRIKTKKSGDRISRICVKVETIAVIGMLISCIARYFV